MLLEKNMGYHQKIGQFSNAPMPKLSGAVKTADGV
jgi:hypothetical protein